MTKVKGRLNSAQLGGIGSPPQSASLPQAMTFAHSMSFELESKTMIAIRRGFCWMSIAAVAASSMVPRWSSADISR